MPTSGAAFWSPSYRAPIRMFGLNAPAPLWLQMLESAAPKPTWCR
jgi:hypothetical protein